MRRMLDEENLLFKASAQAPLTAQEVADYLNQQEIQVTAKGSFEMYEDDPDITYFTDKADYEKHTTVYPLYLNFYNDDFYITGTLRLTLQFPDTIEDDEALAKYVTEGLGRFILLAIDDFDKDESSIEVHFGGWLSKTNGNWEIIPDFKIGDTLTIPEEEEPYTCLIHGKTTKITPEELTNQSFGYLTTGTGLGPMPYAENMRITGTLQADYIQPASGASSSHVVTISNLKVTRNVNVDGYLAAKEQTWGYTMTESIDKDNNNYSVNGSASFGNGQKGELKVMARIDDSGNMIVADFEFNQTAVNSQEVQFTYPIRYYDANENWHWGHLIVGGSLVGLDKKPHLFAYILGDNDTHLSLVPIDQANYQNSTYGIKIEVLPH